MQAILTKVIPATNTKPTRIKATCARGSITIWSDSLSEGHHVMVVRALCARFADEDAKQYGTPKNKNPWLRRKACGQLPNGDYAHVFI